MKSRNTVIRSMHDVGLAAWFGGSLMGAVGLNGGANSVDDATQRPVVASAGWARWAPVNAAAIGIHAIGGVGLILANKGRIAEQKGAGSNTAVKAALTGVALAATAWSGLQGAKVGKAGAFPTEGSVVPSAATPADVASAQKQLRIAQWVIPAATGVLIVLGAQQGEQQKPAQLLAGLLKG
ncbi:hypothetical protein JL107_15865 [Nakamurella flavida]|uniref:Uncharacterized protein n=1 Tax=Nakamurella flavida TaxID=363630 RepID=A0A938YS82_9ACTN|nr:hypothetical protein [Nakamurella flavida]MBM9477925.1 hypothetical protein [Nakamurella flavida]MDP9778360.1 succinate dehydrogenase/fumarate reductase cytochrome b subunit [Nakamurella flavida]